MAVYAQAPTVQSNPVGTFLNAFQTTQNIFERKRRLSMEEERQQREVERLAKAELRAIETHQKNMRSMEIANDTKAYAFDQIRKAEDNANLSLKDMQTDFDDIESNLNFSFNTLNEEGIEGVRNRKAILKHYALRLGQFESKYAHLKNHPVHGATYSQKYSELQQRLLPLSEARQVDQSTEWDEFRKAIGGVMREKDPDKAMDAFAALDENFGDLEVSPMYSQMYQNRRKELKDFVTQRFNLDATPKERREEEDWEKGKKAEIEQIDKALSQVEKALGDIDEAYVGDFWSRTKGNLRAFFLGQREIELNFENISSSAWVEMVSQLKGALSDREGARFDKAVPNDKTDKEAWKQYLYDMRDFLEGKLDSEGNPIGGGEKKPPNIQDAREMLTNPNVRPGTNRPNRRSG